MQSIPLVLFAERFSDVKNLLSLTTFLLLKVEFETKIKTVLFEARKRLEHRRAFPQRETPLP
jgi:hypothetical protein